MEDIERRVTIEEYKDNTTDQVVIFKIKRIKLRKKVNIKLFILNIFLFTAFILLDIFFHNWVFDNTLGVNKWL